mgnify:FL=1
MTTMEAIHTRRSIRAYKPDPVDRAVLEEVLEAASWAPSWKNSQTVRYVVIDTPEARQALLQTDLPPFNRRVVEQAPVVIAMVTNTGISGYLPDGTPNTTLGAGWQMFDAGIAAQTLCLAAWEKGLGTLIMGLYDEAGTPGVLGLEPGQIVTALVAMGYAETQPKGPGRKDSGELYRYL